jgi:hypothetical protein
VDYHLELLKRIPKEHYTLHENKLIKVGDLLKLLLEDTSKKAEDKSMKKETG